MTTFASNIEPPSIKRAPDSALASVASLCAESGWPFVERDGECLVKLEVSREGVPFSARVGRAADGGMEAWVHLAAAAAELGNGSALEEATESASESAEGRQAVEAIFGEISKRVRLVRGAFKDAPVAGRPGFEVLIPADSGGKELSDALAALSVACQLAGPEIQLVLSDPFIAESYLAQSSRARGCSSSRQVTSDTCVSGGAFSS